jgi:hypothetical protein
MDRPGEPPEETSATTADVFDLAINRLFARRWPDGRVGIVGSPRLVMRRQVREMPMSMVMRSNCSRRSTMFCRYGYRPQYDDDQYESRNQFSHP